MAIVTTAINALRLLFNKTSLKAICWLSAGLFVLWSITLHQKNKKLSESLEMAQNNIEAYQGIVAEKDEANSTLVLSVEQLKQSKDSLIQRLDSVLKSKKVKTKNLNTAATQTQTIDVMGGKGGLDVIYLISDSIYRDTIQYNDYTIVGYTIGKDTVGINLDIRNIQYLYTYKHKKYKNKKHFLKRLFTLDFKKVTKYKYEIVNTNDLIKTSDVRVIEVID